MPAKVCYSANSLTHTAMARAIARGCFGKVIDPVVRQTL